MQAASANKPSSSGESETATDPRATIESPLVTQLEHLSVRERAVSPDQTRSLCATTTPTRDNDEMDNTSNAMSTKTAAARTPDHRRVSPPVTGNSPSTSQVSTGSIGPTLVAAAFRHCELTPVTRNTSSSSSAQQQVGTRSSSASLYVDDHHRRKPGSRSASLNQAMLVSPDHYQDDFLHGELLNLSADDVLLTDDDDPLGLPRLHRERSVGNLDQQALWNHHHDTPGPAVEFPERKANTFTSREQYEEELLRHQQHQQHNYGMEHHHLLMGTSSTTTASTPGQPSSVLRPYQPTREDEGVGNLPPEALSQIFIARRYNNNNGENGESHQNHRLNNAVDTSLIQHHLQQPYAMDDRQGSIPSLHLAHHLNASTTSVGTTTDEDEESLQYYYTAPQYQRQQQQQLVPADDWSLSSRDDDVGNLLLQTPILTSTTTPNPFFEHVDLVHSHDNTTADDDDSSLQAVVGGRKRNRRQQALDWIESVKGDPTEIAEAASSRFLTGRTQTSTPTTATKASTSTSSTAEPKALFFSTRNSVHTPNTADLSIRAPPMLAPRRSLNQSSEAVFRDLPTMIRPAKSQEQDEKQPPTSPTF